MNNSDHLKRNMYVTADNNPLQLTASSTKKSAIRFMKWHCLNTMNWKYILTFIFLTIISNLKRLFEVDKVQECQLLIEIMCML